MSPETGQIWQDEYGGIFRVMAVADGYVMMRRPRCCPFIRGVTEFKRLYSPVAKSNREFAKMRAANQARS